jgi:hypothetical protein
MNLYAFWNSSDGSQYVLPDFPNPPFFDDSTFDYDYWWEGDQWYMGDSFSFGYGDTYWLYSFPTTWRYGYPVDYVMISFIGTLPQ